MLIERTFFIKIIKTTHLALTIKNIANFSKLSNKKADKLFENQVWSGAKVSPLGRARYRPARDLHRYPARPRAAPPLGGAAPGLRVSPSGHGSRVAASGAWLRFRGPSWVQLRRWWLG